MSALGKLLQVDIVTATNSRVRYVRASVEMEAYGDFLKEFDMECIDGSVYWVDVEYHILSLRCSKCQVFGHNDSSCLEEPIPQSNAQVREEAVANPNMVNDRVSRHHNVGVILKEANEEIPLEQARVFSSKGKMIVANVSSDSTNQDLGQPGSS